MKKEINWGKVKNLRYYNSKKSGNTFFVNGACFNMIDKKTYIIYTNGVEGVPMILPRDKFEQAFELAK